MRHRAPRRRRRTLIVVVAILSASAVLEFPFRWPLEHAPERTAKELGRAAPVVRPTARARPRYLTQSYRAPPALIRPGEGGTLRIPSLGIRAPIDAVGLDDTAMAVPDDVARLGWLTSSARADDVVGASVLAGHVSDRNDQPGALSRLKAIKVGAAIIWIDYEHRVHRYLVTDLQRFPRRTGLSAELFATDGQHVLHLVTCADREATAGGGFHYRSNLVVTAREVTHQTRRGTTD